MKNKFLYLDTASTTPIAPEVIKAMLEYMGAAKASDAILRLVFGNAFEQHSQRLANASIIHFRSYNKEFRVWQGTVWQPATCGDGIREFISCGQIECLVALQAVCTQVLYSPKR